MALPENLEAWTYETVEELVRTREFEPEGFDYKALLESQANDRGERDKHNNRIRRAASALANTNGGFIVFGVKDRETRVVQPEDRIVGIPLGRDILADFGRKLEEIQPNISFDALPQAIKLPNDPDKGIFVVRIPQSIRRPHMVLSEHVCYRRDAGGFNLAMDIYQIRDQLLFTQDRLNRALLLSEELRSVHKTANNMRQGWQVNAELIRLLRFRVTTIQGLFGDVMTLPTSANFQKDMPRLLRGANTYNDMLDMTTRAGLNRDGQLGHPKVQQLTGEARLLLPEIANLSRQCFDELRVLAGLAPEAIDAQE